MSADPLYDKSEAWTKEQYELMKERAIELGYYPLTPWRKGIKNIRIGVIKAINESTTNNKAGGE